MIICVLFVYLYLCVSCMCELMWASCVCELMCASRNVGEVPVIQVSRAEVTTSRGGPELVPGHELVHHQYPFHLKDKFY